MIFKDIKILILKAIAMKNSFFSKTLAIIFLFGGLSVSAQVRVKTNNSIKNKNVVKTHHLNNHRKGVRVKSNRYKVVKNKPNRPRVIVKRPTYNRNGYVWTEGYWRWNTFYRQYTWQKARWIKIKRNHYWVPGSWQIAVGGFFWVEGYWELGF